MQYKFFTIPVFSSEVFEVELNTFLRGHHVLSVRRELIMDGQQSVWACCVEYTECEEPVKGKRGKIDYFEVLPAEEFARFRVMREVRKNIAEEDGIPAFAIMIDEQLATLSKLPSVDESALKSLDGFGEKQFERFGKRFLEMVHKKADEKSK